MAKLNSFTDFEAFQASRSFVREVGLLIRSPRFRHDRVLFLQMERAAISVLSNFAEGFERDGNAEFAQFLSISKGSIGELRGQLIYCLDVGLIEEPLHREGLMTSPMCHAYGRRTDAVSFGCRIKGTKVRPKSREKVKSPNPVVAPSPTVNRELRTENHEPFTNGPPNCPT